MARRQWLLRCHPCGRCRCCRGSRRYTNRWSDCCLAPVNVELVVVNASGRRHRQSRFPNIVLHAVDGDVLLERHIRIDWTCGRSSRGVEDISARGQAPDAAGNTVCGSAT